MANLITIIVSEDPYLIDREVASIQKATVDPSFADFNLNRFSVKEHSISSILDTCSMLPMMGGERLVLVSEADALKKDDLEILLPYLENPCPSARLVLIASKIDKRLKAWQKAVKAGWVTELKPPFPNQLPAWIDKEAKRMGLTLSLQACQALAESIGVQLRAIISALEQLEIYAIPRKKIELGDVTAVAGDFLSKSVFDFTETVANRNFPEAERQLTQMITKGEPLIRLLFMVTRHFRLLQIAQEGLQARWDERTLAQNLGVNPFFVKDYVQQAKKMAPEKLRKIYGSLLKTDRSLKRTPLESRLIVDRFLMEACF